MGGAECGDWKNSKNWRVGYEACFVSRGIELGFTLCIDGYADDAFDQKFVKQIFATDRHSDEFAKIGSQSGFLAFCDRTREEKALVLDAVNKAMAYAKNLEFAGESTDSIRMLRTAYVLNTQGIVDGAKTTSIHMAEMTATSTNDKIKFCSKI